VHTAFSDCCWKCTKKTVPTAKRDVPTRVSFAARDMIFYSLLTISISLLNLRCQLRSSIRHGRVVRQVVDKNDAICGRRKLPSRGLGALFAFELSPAERGTAPAPPAITSFTTKPELWIHQGGLQDGMFILVLYLGMGS